MNSNSIKPTSQSRNASIASIASSETSETPSVSDDPGINNSSRKVIFLKFYIINP